MRPPVKIQQILQRHALGETITEKEKKDLSKWRESLAGKAHKKRATRKVARGKTEKKDPNNLTQEQAEKLLKADLANLAKKVKDGKTLTAGERNLLQNAVETGSKAAVKTTENYVSNMVELAVVLGVDRKTIQRSMKMEGCPGRRPNGRYDVNAWKAWRNNRRGISDAEGMTGAQLKARQVLLQNQKIEFQLSVMRGEKVDIADLEKWVADMVLNAKKILYSMPPSLAPQVVGVSVPEAEQRIRECIDEAMEQLHAAPWEHRRTLVEEEA